MATDDSALHLARVAALDAAVCRVLAAIGAPARVQISRKAAGWWHPGRSGVIGLGPNVMATFGEVHPRILAAMDVKGPAVAFTILVANVPLPKVKTPTKPALVLSDLQAVDRDFAFVVDKGVEALTAVNAATGADKTLIESVRVFDQFSGLQVGFVNFLSQTHPIRNARDIENYLARLIRAGHRVAIAEQVVLALAG